jgi:BolA protein
MAFRAAALRAAGFRGPVQDIVESKLINAFGQASVHSVVNESHGKIENESHFHVHIVSDSFQGLGLLKRHRLINAALTDNGGQLPFHSLRITAQTVAQAPPDAPKCKGGDGIGLTR